MGLLVVKSDFVGKYDLPKSINDKIDAYIAEYEEKILTEMLGDDLFTAFKTNVDSTIRKPVLQIYLDLYNPVTVEAWDCSLRSEGMKEMLLGFIFFHYVRDEPFKVGMNGAVVNQTETSTQANTSFLYTRYNEAVKNYNIILSYANDNRAAVYPTLKGRFKSFSSWV